MRFNYQPGKSQLIILTFNLDGTASGITKREGIFDDIWIQPAAGDAGGALGAALFVWHQYLENPRIVDNQNQIQRGSYLGPEFTDEEIKKIGIRVSQTAG